MSKALLAVWRSAQARNLDDFVERADRQLSPDHYTPSPSYWHLDGTAFTYIFNPTSTLLVNLNSCCLGVVQQDGQDVLEPGGPRPEGSFALFRAGPNVVEILTDYVGSRTIWFYEDSELFAASTSQRMLVLLLGSFDPNPTAVRWMLNTGTLGPGVSWDRRLTMLLPRGTLHLDRKSFTVRTVPSSRLTFERVYTRGRTATRVFSKTVESAVSRLKLKGHDWNLALSGGMDSRLLLSFLRGRPGLRAVTWSTKEALDQTAGDSAIAKLLSESCGVPHEYAMLGSSQGEVPHFRKILDRFVKAGEGRIDHISGYMDGLELWRAMAESQRSCIRGYDAFGRKPPVATAFQARRASTLLVSADLRGFPIPAEFSLTIDDIPGYLSRRAGERLNDWRDRLWLEFRTPFVTAALDDIKLAYVEIANPLLSASVVRLVQGLDPRLRSNKAIVRSVVRAQFPGVPFAKRESVENVEAIVSRPSIRDALADVLMASDGILPAHFVRRVLHSLEKPDSKYAGWRAVSAARGFIPRPVENLARRNVRFVTLASGRIALRCAIVTRLHGVLGDDARVSTRVV